MPYLYLVADDPILEAIAGAPPGAAATLAAIDTTFRRAIAGYPTTSPVVSLAFDDREAAITALGHGVIALDNLIYGQGLQAFDPQAAAMTLHLPIVDNCIHDPPAVIALLAEQWHWADREHPPFAAIFRTIVERAITAARAGVCGLVWR